MKLRASEGLQYLGRAILLVTALVVSITLTTNIAYAQSQAINGSIRGRITDPAEAPVAGATVKIESEGTEISRSFDTGRMGTTSFQTCRLALTPLRSGKKDSKRNGIQAWS